MRILTLQEMTAVSGAQAGFKVVGATGQSTSNTNAVFEIAMLAQGAGQVFDGFMGLLPEDPSGYKQHIAQVRPCFIAAVVVWNCTVKYNQTGSFTGSDNTLTA